MVGYRVVCHNLQDVERATDVLAKSLKAKSIPVTKRDYVKRARKEGYRAIHLRIAIQIKIGGEQRVIGCEVQIRSLLQNAWAELSRVDLYAKEADLDPSLLRSMERLAQLLHVADHVANDIREQIARPREGEPPAEGASLTAPSIAFLYQRAFGEPCPDYVVQSTLREFEGTHIRADGLDVILKDTAFLEKLRWKYEKSAGWETMTEQVFRWAVHAAAHGTDSALHLVEKDGEADREEINSAFLREVESELPETWEELVEMIESIDKDKDPQHDIMRWANAFGALSECTICSTKIVRTDSLAEELADHYKLEGDAAEEAAQAIERAVLNSGVETRDLDNSSYCNYHGDVMSRDD